MLTLLRLTVWFAFVLCASTAAAQDRPAADVQPLQGSWVVTAAEHAGAPMNGLNGGVLTITGSRFEIRTASGNLLRGELHADPAKAPAQLDLTHADGAVWEAIYRIDGDELRLNYVEKGEKDPRPSAFATSKATEESLIVLTRR